MGPQGRRPGFSLVEVVIVLAAIGILVAIASPFQMKAMDGARGAVTRSHLRNALLAELTYYSQHNVFTNDRATLLAIDGSLPLGEEGTAGSIYIAISRAPGGPAICLFAEGAAGDWQTMYYSTRTDVTSDLASPKDCTRRMLDETLDEASRRTHEAPPPDTTGTRSIIRR